MNNKHNEYEYWVNAKTNIVINKSTFQQAKKWRLDCCLLLFLLYLSALTAKSHLSWNQS